jgi:protein-export membrane protein SecD
MKPLQRILIVVFLVLTCGAYIVPWNNFFSADQIKENKFLTFLAKPFTLGLDLQGGVELDYKVDLESVKGSTGGTINERDIVEGIKSVIDRRVIEGLKLSEPTIQTAQYGKEMHIIVQIPTQDYGNVSEEEKIRRNREDVTRAKDVIGKVVQLEFREQKTETTESDRIERRLVADKAIADLKDTSFEVVGAKYRDQEERVTFASGTGSLPSEALFSGYDTITKFPHTTGVVETSGMAEYTIGADGQPMIRTNSGYAIVRLDAKIGTGANYQYSYIFFDQKPSEWKAAKTADGKILNDKYLISAGVWFTQAGQSQVELVFNDQGKKIFAELTKRLLNKQIAIFVGGQLLTAPTVQAVIADGRAVITGNYTLESARALANNINTGIVPAPIYLTSERTIDAKIGSHALGEILNAGLIGLLVIVVFLSIFYRVSGLLAGVALVIYTIILVALIKFFGSVLTLASIAWVILSIGLAIDANILIFERMREALKDGQPLDKAIQTGFDKSWTAIWDSHVTSLSSAVILYIFGISLIKGFGFMLGLGIVLSLFTSMWVSRALIITLAKLMGKNTLWFIGFKK